MKKEQQNLIDKATIRYYGTTVRKLWGSQMVKSYRLFLGGCLSLGIVGLAGLDNQQKPIFWGLWGKIGNLTTIAGAI